MTENLDILQKENKHLKCELKLLRKSRPDFTTALTELHERYRGYVANLRTELSVERDKTKRAQDSIKSLQEQIKQVKEQKVEEFEQAFIKKVKVDFEKERYCLTDNEIKLFARIKAYDGLSTYQLANYCWMKPTTAQYTINSLQMKGLIRTRKVGRQRLCYVKKKMKEKDNTTNKTIGL